MVEHKRVVNSKDPLNGIAVHVQKTAHNINWQEARILARENNCGKKWVLHREVITDFGRLMIGMSNFYHLRPDS